MNRREILRYTAWLTGTAVSAPLAAAILSGCSPTPNGTGSTTNGEDAPELSAALHFFSPEQFALLGVIADAILPRTDSPSATDVGAHQTLDAMFGLVFDGDFQRQFRENWYQLERHLADQHFGDLDSSEKAQVLTALEIGEITDLAEARAGFVEVKQQLVAYYLTSEEVGKNFLNYVPVPGTYSPCISVDDVNNTAWAI
ncbi:gluconate 2-dehydrogenase subunit 3 family protein [Marinimicrobium alkaliphilum]|uniref:gluconate 2-dehydrogenase subunit 3 family protein n=1 Tax=Marinimicrobium alkaliphilum TaxID=2202654 RepID=UPI000DBA0C70|nr:gluconate 2-dehydrogenase subunit 3 family protein [Marinimicrobium alkaliphilum]